MAIVCLVGSCLSIAVTAQDLLEEGQDRILRRRRATRRWHTGCNRAADGRPGGATEEMRP